MNFPYEKHNDRPAHTTKQFVDKYFPQWFDFTRVPQDPLHSFLDLSLNHFSEILYEDISKVENNFIYSTIDIDEPDHYYDLLLDKLPQQLNITVRAKATDENPVNIYRCTTNEEFLTKIFTRLDYANGYNSFKHLNISFPNDVRGLSFAFEENNAINQRLYFLVSGIYLYKYNIIPNYTTETSYDFLLEEESHRDMRQVNIQEKVSIQPDNTLILSHVPNSFNELYDYGFLDINNNPFKVNTNEYSISENVIHLSGIRPSFNPLYYQGHPSGQPDVGWHGKYIADYSYNVFTTGTHMTYKNKNNDINYFIKDDSPVISINGTNMIIPYEYSETINDNIIKLRVDIDDLRPGSSVSVSGMTFMVNEITYDDFKTDTTIYISGLINETIVNEEIDPSGIILYKNETPINISYEPSGISIAQISGIWNIDISVPDDYSFNKVIVPVKEFIWMPDISSYASYTIESGINAQEDFKVEDNTYVYPYTIIDILDTTDIYDNLYPIKNALIRDYNANSKIYTIFYTPKWEGIDFDKYYNSFWHIDSNSSTLYLKDAFGTTIRKIFLDSFDNTFAIKFDLSSYGYKNKLILKTNERIHPEYIFHSVYSYEDMITFIYTYLNEFDILQANKFELTDYYTLDSPIISELIDDSFNYTKILIDHTFMPGQRILMLMNDGSTQDIYILYKKYDYYITNTDYNKISFREKYESITINEDDT